MEEGVPQIGIEIYSFAHGSRKPFRWDQLLARNNLGRGYRRDVSYRILHAAEMQENLPSVPDLPNDGEAKEECLSSPYENLG